MKRANEQYIGDWLEHPTEFEVTMEDVVETYIVVESDPYEFDFDCYEVERVATEVLDFNEWFLELKIIGRKYGKTI